MASEQAQVEGPFESFRARRHPELLVDGPQVGLDRALGHVEAGCDLRAGAGRQELEDALLGRVSCSLITWPGRKILGWAERT